MRTLFSPIPLILENTIDLKFTLDIVTLLKGIYDLNSH